MKIVINCLNYNHMKSGVPVLRTGAWDSGSWFKNCSSLETTSPESVFSVRSWPPWKSGTYKNKVANYGAFSSALRGPPGRVFRCALLSHAACREFYKQGLCIFEQLQKGSYLLFAFLQKRPMTFADKWIEMPFI